MTYLRESALKLKPIAKEAKYDIHKKLIRLQEARIDIRNEATLENILSARNPYFLRSTRKVASVLVSYCFDSYLLSADEVQFANFSHELRASMDERNQRLFDSAAMLELFAQNALPLRINLLDAHDRACNRLIHQFCIEFCDKSAVINWWRLTQFILRLGDTCSRN